MNSRLNIMRCLTLMGVALSSSCMTERDATNFSYAFVRHVFSDRCDVIFWSEVFVQRNGRMPRDYEELRQFVRRHMRSSKSLESYGEIEFMLSPTGERKVVFYDIQGDKTNKTSVTWSKPGPK